MSLTINIEGTYIVLSSIKVAIKNLKKIEEIYDKINAVNFKKLKGPKHHIIYYELWFIFIDEMVHLQKDIIDCMTNGCNDQQIKLLVEKIKLLIKPTSTISFFKFKPPQIQLHVPKCIYDLF